MLRSAQPSQFSTYPSQYIDTPGLAVLIDIDIYIYFVLGKINCHTQTAIELIDI